MAIKRRVPRKGKPTVELGIDGWRVPVHSHIAYLWETERDFAEAVGFVGAGLLGSDHCVLVGGREEYQRVAGSLAGRGIDVESYRVRQRLSVIGPEPSGEMMLNRISATFEAALAAGAPVVRLFGTVQWGHAAWPPDAEVLSLEAHLTRIAERYPSVILCLHEVRSLTGLILRHGVFSTHPQVLEEGGVLGNPCFVPLDRLLDRLGAITADVAERQRQRETLKRAEMALQRSYEELRALSTRLQTVREEESKRLAREVHDEIGQMLTALGMDVSWLQNGLGAIPPAVRDEISGKLESMRQLLEAAVDSVQRIVTELRPVVLDELGLAAAVEWYVEEFASRTGLACRLVSSLGGVNLDADRSTALFRILQEALTNVVRHADATAVEIRLAAEEGRVLLTVTDNGRGIPEDKVADSRSLGLLGMRERARALGGELVVRRNPGDGTTVEVTVPP